MRPCSRQTEPTSRHGLPTIARPSGGRCVRGQLDLPGVGPAAVCERDAVDPPSAGGVCGQPLGIQQCGPGSGLHVLLPALHLPVRTTQTSVARCLGVVGLSVCFISRPLRAGRCWRPTGTEGWRRPCPLASSSSSSQGT